MAVGWPWDDRGFGKLNNKKIIQHGIKSEVLKKQQNRRFGIWRVLGDHTIFDFFSVEQRELIHP